MISARRLCCTVFLELLAATTFVSAAVLEFPDAPVGVVITSPVRHSEKPTWGISNMGTQAKKAVGRVETPVGHFIGLEISGKSQHGITCLGQLPEDSLDTVVISNAEIGQNGFDWLSRQRNLRKLELRGCHVHVDAFHAFAEHSTNLMHLYVSLSGDETVVRERIAKAVAKMPQLSNLVSSPSLDGAALAWVAGHTRLSSINVEIEEDAHEVLDELARLPKLSRLFIRTSEQLDATAAKKLARLPLRTIQWFRGNVDSTLMSAFAQNNELTALELLSIAPGEDFINGLKRLRSLERLKLSHRDSGLSSEALQAALLTLPRLKEWPRIEYICRATLQQLPSHPQIEQLSIKGIADDVAKSDLQNIFELENLRSLSLEFVPLGDDLAKRLASLSRLEELTLWSTGTTDSGLAGLQSLRKLRSLRLFVDSPTQTNLSVLAKLPVLEDLELAGRHLQPIHLKPLRHCPELVRFNLMGGVHVDDSTAEWLCANPKLASLRLGDGCVVSDRGAIQFASLPNLQELIVAGVIRSKTVERLADASGSRKLVVRTQAIPQDERAILKKRFVELTRCDIRPLEGLHIGTDGIIRSGNRTTLDSLEGKPAPTFENSAAASSDVIRLSKLRGKVVLLDFWGTWCDGCLLAHPELVRLHQQFDNADFEVVGVHSKGGAEDLQAYLNENPLPWSTIVDSGHIAASYRVEGYPTYFLIDKHGNLRAAGVSTMDLEHGIRVLLNESVRQQERGDAKRSQPE